MSKAQNQQTSTTAINQQNQTNAQSQQLMNQFGGEAATARGQAQETYSGAQQGFNNQQTYGGYDPSMLSNLRGATGTSAATGGYDPTAAAGLTSDLKGYTGTGGFDQSSLDSLSQQEKDLAASGNFDPTVASNIAQGYTSLATTGGFTPEQEGAFYERGTEGVQNTYNTLANQLAQSKAKTGGLGGGGDTAQMARQLAQAQAASTLDTGVALNQQETANKIAGLGGLESSTAEQLRTKQAGMQGALTQAGLTAGQQATNRDNLLNQQQSFQTSQALGKQAGLQQQLGLEGDVAKGVQGANAGLAGMFKDASGNLTAQGQQILQALGINVTSQGQLDQVLASLASNTKGPLSNTEDIMKMVFNPGGFSSPPGLGG